MRLGVTCTQEFFILFNQENYKKSLPILLYGQSMVIMGSLVVTHVVPPTQKNCKKNGVCSQYMTTPLKIGDFFVTKKVEGASRKVVTLINIQFSFQFLIHLTRDSGL